MVTVYSLPGIMKFTTNNEHNITRFAMHEVECCQLGTNKTDNCGAQEHEPPEISTVGVDVVDMTSGRPLEIPGSTTHE
jgi:hypothetical protein